MKKKLSLLMVSCMIVSSLSHANVSAATLQNEVTNDKQAQSVLSRIAEDTTVTMLGNQKVTLLVELKEPSLLEYFNETQTYARSGGRNSYDNFNAFSNSHDGLEQKSIIEKQQDDVIEKIEKKINEGKDVNVIRQFSDVANMIVIDATMKDIEEIKKISGVKAVNISYTYARPKVEYTEEQKTGRDLINGYDLDYTGKKQVVAVLDTGADIKHNAFAVTLAEDSIRYKKSDITKLLEDKTFNSEENGEGKSLTVADVSSYKGNKIVYAYDYADKDANVVPSVASVIDSGNDHGNHVAGIIGALSDEMSGIAPDCQLAIMKVFPDSNSGAPDYVVLAALEDCLKLDVDVINMSLGAACGYTHDEHDVREKVFNDIKEAGINLVVSAGNSGQSSDDNFWDGHALTSNPDTSTVGSPSTNPAALSVASLENTIHYGPCIIASDGTEIFGADSAVQSEFKFDIFATETVAEYVEIPDFGEEEDYEDIEVDGKVALVSRGTISFEDKQKIAFEKGAKAIIIYNNTNDGLISMSIKDRKIPSVFITKADGEKLKNLTDKKFTTKPGFYENENKGKMSGFSSWGCTPDLKLKPEITGVGGFIYSTLPFNTYGNMQGTSMSAPQIAGAVAVMKQYIAENNDKFSVVEGANQKGVVLENLVNNILMSTADVVTVSGSALGVKEEVRVPYSPRVQGAGLANLAAAIKTNAYLYNENNTETGRPVINYGESVEGVFTQNFQIRNISDKPVKYALDATVLSDEADVLDFELTGQRKNVISGTPFQLTANSTIKINSPTGAEFVSGDAIGLKESAVSGCAITIAPNSTVDLSLSIKLSEEDKEYLDNNFENGDFVEGFLKFNAVDDTNVDLSIPFLGFYGSWEKAPILETNIYDFFDGKVEDFPSNFTLRYLFSNTNRLGGIVDLGNRNGYITLGTNLYSDKQDAYSKYISISPNGDGYFDSFTWMYCPLRNPKKTDYYITTEDGTVVYEKHETGDRKSVYDDSTGKFDEWYGFMDWNGMYSGRPIPNNTELKFIFKAQIENATCVNENNTVTLPVVIDTEKPMLKDFEVDLDNQVLRVTISDNQYLCGGSLQDIEAYNEEIEKYLAGLTDEIDSDAYLQETPIANPEKKTEYTLEFSLNPEHDHYELEFSDYALNMRVFEIDLNEYKDTPTDTPTATPTPSNPNPGSGDQPVVTPTTTPTPTPTVTPEPEDDQTVVTTVDVADAKNAVVEEEKLEEALSEKKDVLIEIKDGDKVAYAWEFAANDYSKDVKLHDIKLGVTTKTGEESAYKNGVEVQFEQEGVLPMEAKVKVNVGDSFKPNQKVYLYRKDEKTGKLLCVPFSTYTVAKDGTVTLNVVQGDDYVILGKPAKSKDKVTVVNQIQVEKNVACKKGETISVAAQLPATLVRVSSMKEVSKSADATFGAVVTYKVSDSKVATVDKNGNLVAKKAGKVTVTVKVKLSNGVTKTFQTKVTIK